MISSARARILAIVLGALAACRASDSHSGSQSGPGSASATQPAPTSSRNDVASAHAIELSPSIRPRTAPFDVENYAISVALDPAQRTIDATCSVRLWPTEPKLAHVDLDFVGMDITAVRDRDGRDLKWNRADGLLGIDLATPIQRGSFEVITVAYHGHPERGLWFTDERDGAPHEVFTQGECQDARAWFPCLDQTAERATSEVRVTMPRAWTSLACGERVDRTEDGERATETWRMTFPHPTYLESLVAGDMLVQTDQWDGIPLVYAADPRFAAVLQPSFAETGAILAYFSDVTGVRYPYAKYSQACVDNFPFGGMENISATTLTDTMLPDARDLADLHTFGLVAHEAAHQWFGDYVTCQDWSQAWLNEGFATYFGALYTEKSRGVDAFRREMHGNRAAYLARNKGTNMRPIVYGTAREPFELFFSGHIYQGGATCLNHLRSVLGDDAFFRGVRRYLSDHKNHSVVTDDLRVAMEAASGTDLRWFFDQWFYAAGVPDVKSHWSVDKAKGTVEIFLEQTQDAPETPPVFRLPIDVEIVSSASTRIERVVMDRRAQSFTLACEPPLEWVRIDPFDTVPMRLDEEMPVANWVTMADEASDPGGRLRALTLLDASARRSHEKNALQTTSEDQVMAKLNPIPQAEPEERILLMRAHHRITFPGARDGKPATEHLASGNVLVGTDRRELMAAAATDPDMDVRAAAWELLGDHAPEAELDRFAREEATRVESSKVRGAIADVVAKCEGDAAYDWLVGQLSESTVHGAYEARILGKIAATQDDRRLALLTEWARDETKPDEARVVAVHAVGRFKNQATSVDTLCAVLDSSRFRVRRAAIQALGELRDPRSRSALQQFRARTSIDTEKRAADDALAHLPDGS